PLGIEKAGDIAADGADVHEPHPGLMALALQVLCLVPGQPTRVDLAVLEGQPSKRHYKLTVLGDLVPHRHPGLVTPWMPADHMGEDDLQSCGAVRVARDGVSP